MHIGFLTPEYPHPETGKSAGLGSSIKNLAHSLVKNGVEVSIFLYGQNKTREFEVDGLQVYMIEQRRYSILGWYLYRKFLEKYLNDIIKRDRIDLIEAPDWTGITALMNLNCPLVIRMHGSDAYFCHLENRKQKRKNYWFEKMALRGADHLLSVSQFTADETSEIFNLKKKITVIHNGVDTGKFVPHEGEPKEKSILYFGSLIRKKGVIELAKIFNKVIEEEPEAFLTVVGKDVIDVSKKGSTLEIIREVLSQKTLKRFRHVPEVPYENVKDLLSSNCVVVFPSFAEAFPMSWLEAMAMQKALVTSNIGWSSEIMINGKTGYMVDPLKHREFAEKILFLLRNREERAKMENFSRTMICDKFSAELIATKNIEFYKDVSGRKI